MGQGTPTLLQVTGLKLKPESCLLDMARDAFDDQYEGCIQQMDKRAPQLLEEELNMNKEFKKQWLKSKNHWMNIKDNESITKIISQPFNDFHGIALVAYTGDISNEFNKAIKEFGQNPSNFHFKAFHYYLTRALQLLNKGKCHSVYRGCTTKFQLSGSKNVRFGQFASASLNKTIADEFRDDSGTLFTIETCLGVYIKHFSHYQREEEVLIPGYEVYQEVNQQVFKKYDRISLRKPKKGRSKYNCFYVSSTHGELSNNINNTGKTGSVPGGVFLKQERDRVLTPEATRPKNNGTINSVLSSIRFLKIQG